MRLLTGVCAMAFSSTYQSSPAAMNTLLVLSQTEGHRSAGACPPRTFGRPKHGEGQALALRGRNGSTAREAAIDPGTARDRPSPYGGGRPFFALREDRRQLPNQPHRLLTDMHHLPHQPHNILRIRNIRIRHKPTPIRIRFDAIPIDEPL